MSAPAPVRVLIVDDDPLVRAGLVTLLEGGPGLEVVGGAGDGAAALTAVEQAVPPVDVVLMDIRMPGVDGITATARLRELPSPPQVLVLTTFDTDEQVLRALRAGAAGFLLKDTPPERIVSCVHSVAAGEPVLSPAAARRLIDFVADDPAPARRDRARTALAALTERERAVATALADGLTNQEIAAALHLSVATVKAHITRLLRELGLNNRTQVALLAYDARGER
ncbi:MULTISPECIES: response regulator transcription factor [unclassified Streptomyces]|uniref:Response regulator n=1 Tax=Streptomyces sp. R08 TaxID=3238624 RepID=A0AB39MEP6_9ACTN|nr:MULTISPECIES: response regulator transcription factor [unclassified Streptomyces]